MEFENYAEFCKQLQRSLVGCIGNLPVYHCNFPRFHFTLCRMAREHGWSLEVKPDIITSLWHTTQALCQVDRFQAYEVNHQVSQYFDVNGFLMKMKTLPDELHSLTFYLNLASSFVRCHGDLKSKSDLEAILSDYRQTCACKPLDPEFTEKELIRALALKAMRDLPKDIEKRIEAQGRKVVDETVGIEQLRNEFAVRCRVEPRPEHLPVNNARLKSDIEQIKRDLDESERSNSRFSEDYPFVTARFHPNGVIEPLVKPKDSDETK